jgi:NAD(P)-dependent dehydrogenase (short-subunit alcohol dehydrogenase family)
MKNKTVVITGGTGGIGLQTAIGLGRLGARVLVTGRNPDRGDHAVELIRAESESEDIRFVQGDLSNLSAVASLGSDLLAQVSRIDVLINNAGLFAKEFVRSEDGYESGFAVNVVAPLALTHSLLPALKEAAPSRVINVTGGSPSTVLDTDNLQAEKGFDGLNTYSHTKRAMEAMSLTLAEKLDSDGTVPPQNAGRRRRFQRSQSLPVQCLGSNHRPTRRRQRQILQHRLCGNTTQPVSSEPNQPGSRIRLRNIKPATNQTRKPLTFQRGNNT